MKQKQMMLHNVRSGNLTSCRLYDSLDKEKTSSWPTGNEQIDLLLYRHVVNFGAGMSFGFGPKQGPVGNSQTV